MVLCHGGIQVERPIRPIRPSTDTVQGEIFLAFFASACVGGGSVWMRDQKGAALVEAERLMKDTYMMRQE